MKIWRRWNVFSFKIAAINVHPKFFVKRDQWGSSRAQFFINITTNNEQYLVLIFQMWHSQRTLTSIDVVNVSCWKHRWRHRLQKSWKKRHELDWRNITRLLCVEDIATMPTKLCHSGIQRNTWALSMIKWTKQRLQSQDYVSIKICCKNKLGVVLEMYANTWA